ncbi:ChaN family lipoprotein [Anthocerotibacter panamensis]|uniref:ChaN family lipoprotein n=1 Tax=Anthocerotibacter panamensis TaxID=2857077 RepID=UPI001FDA7FA3|nr:ChaN family lipoprotein [Anthocerotibacter panamensis]
MGWTRRRWLQTALGTLAAWRNPVYANEFSALSTPAEATQLATFEDSQTQALQYLVSHRDGTDLLYAVDYHFLSVFNTVSADDLKTMADLVTRDLPHSKTRQRFLEQCLEYCRTTDVMANQTKLQELTQGRRQGSLFMEFYRTQTFDERNQSIDRFTKILLPQRQHLDLSPVLEGAEVVFFGESHSEQGTKDYLKTHLEMLKERGFGAFALEFVSGDEQDFLDSYRPIARDQLLKRILWKEPQPYADLIDRMIAMDIRPIGIGQGSKHLPPANGFVTENRNFQLAHYLMEYLRQPNKTRIAVLTGANHAGYSQDTFEGFQVLTRTHPVPDIPTLVKRYFPHIKVHTAIFEGSNVTPPRALPNPDGGPIRYWRTVKSEIALLGAGKEPFMVALPSTLDDRPLTDWERRYDFYLHLPQV